MASVLGQWPVLPLETATSLRAGEPGRLADTLARTWASERGDGYIAQPPPTPDFLVRCVRPGPALGATSVLR